MIIIDCESPCEECVDNGSKCTKCESSPTPYLFNNVCYSDCPDGTSETSPGVCTSNKLFYCLSWFLALVCVAPCVTCTGTETTCTSCPYSQFLYQSTCHPSCPLGSYQLDSSTCDGNYSFILQCFIFLIECTDPCDTCSGSDDFCTSCESSHPFLYQNKCYTACPDGSYESSGACYGMF